MPDLDIVRVQDSEVVGAEDPEILNWASTNQRILLTHDVNTMTFHFKQHLMKKGSSPGIIFVPQNLPIGLVIDELVLIGTFGFEHEFENQMWFLPLT